MLATLAITTPIFISIAVGFLAVRLGWITKADTRAIGNFVINFALPALIIKALSESSLAQVMNPGYLLAYLLGSLTALFAGLLLNTVIRGRSLATSALFGLGMSCSNSGFIGYPLVLQLLGPPAAVALALCMLVENMLIIPLALVLLESGGNRGQPLPVLLKQIGRRLATHPLLLAIAAGMTLTVLDISLPRPLAQAIDMFAAAAGATALFVIGGSLVGLQVRGMVGDVAWILGGKLFLHPLAVLVALLLLPPFDPVLQTAAFAFACMPMMSIYPILGQRYGQEAVCAAALMATTTAAFFSISLMLWLVGALAVLA